MTSIDKPIHSSRSVYAMLFSGVGGAGFMAFLERLVPEYNFRLTSDNSKVQLLLSGNSQACDYASDFKDNITTIFFVGEACYSPAYLFFYHFYLCVKYVHIRVPWKILRWLNKQLLYFIVRRRYDVMRSFFTNVHYRYSPIYERFSKNHSVYALVGSDIPKHCQSDRSVSIPYFIVYYEAMLYKRSPAELKQPTKVLSEDYINRRFCIYVGTNVHKLHSVDIYRALRKYKHVDWYGELPIFAQGRLKGRHYHAQRHYRNYKFVMCIENTSAENYISEKIFRALEESTIPIYWGTSRIKDYFNEKRFVYVQDYKNYNELRQRIKELDQDHKQYMDMVSQPVFTEKNLENVHKAEQKARALLLKVLEKVTK